MTLFLRSLLALILLAAPAFAVQKAPVGKPGEAVKAIGAAAQTVPGLPQAAAAPAAPGAKSAGAVVQSAAQAGPAAAQEPRAVEQAAQAAASNDIVWDGKAEARDEAAEAYIAGNPGSKTVEVLREASGGRTFRENAAQLLVHNVYTQHKPGQFELDGIAPPWAPRQFLDAVLELFRFSERAAKDPAAARFVDAAAHAAAEDWVKRYAGVGNAMVLPASAHKGGEYWDLATGPNGVLLMVGRRDPATTYRFFDLSDFTSAMLVHAKRMLADQGAPVSNVEIVKADIRKLARPPTPLSGLRSKNIQTYAEGSERDLEKMTDWIAVGGSLFLDNDPSPGHRFSVVKAMGPMIERLLAMGWTFSSSGFSQRGSQDLETLTLTRPAAGAKPDAASKAAWAKYRADVAAMNRPQRGGGFYILRF